MADTDLAGQPLAGRTIVVTRSRDQASSLSAQLRALGAAVLEIPTIAIAPPRSWEPLDRALASLADYDWLIVTSANTARVMGERLARGSLARGVQPSTVAVGTATATALEQVGFRVDLVPQPAVAESIRDALGARVRDKHVLLLRAEIARDLLPAALEQAGARVTIVDAYRTILAEQSGSLVAAAFASVDGISPLDALTFTSSSTVSNLAELLRRAGLGWPAGVRVFSIGPITSQTLREQGVQPTAEAAEHDVSGLVACVVANLGRG